MSSIIFSFDLNKNAAITEIGTLRFVIPTVFIDSKRYQLNHTLIFF